MSFDHDESSALRIMVHSAMSMIFIVLCHAKNDKCLFAKPEKPAMAILLKKYVVRQRFFTNFFGWHGRRRVTACISEGYDEKTPPAILKPKAFSWRRIIFYLGVSLSASQRLAPRKTSTAAESVAVHL